MPTNVYSFANDRFAPLDLPASKPLRWASWHPENSHCLFVGNGGVALRFDPSISLKAGSKGVESLDTGSKHNLRGAAFSPNGARALLCGNRGALLAIEGDAARAIASGTTENLRRIAWRPQGDYALVIGNAGTVLRYDASTGDVTPVPGDRAHTLRTASWRPDGAYALIGAYASKWAGYPRPHPLYKCDGVYLQSLLHSDDEDDFVAIDWHPDGHRALIAGYAYSSRGASNKLLVYDGSGFSYQPIEAGGALLGAAWHPSGEYALLCGENGVLLKYSDSHVEQLTSGTSDNLVGPFWRPDGSSALLLRGPSERVYTV
jgi:WD40 repeat protein